MWRASSYFLLLLIALCAISCGENSLTHHPAGVRRIRPQRQLRRDTASPQKTYPLRVLETPARHVRLAVIGPLAERFGIRATDAHLAFVARAAPLYVVGGSRGICLLDGANRLTNCWATHVVLDGDAEVANLCPLPRNIARTIELAGILPDGVGRVVIHRPRHRPQSIQVVNNAFVADLPAGDPLPTAVSWMHHGRYEEHPSGIPRGTRQGRCA